MPNRNQSTNEDQTETGRRYGRRDLLKGIGTVGLSLSGLTGNALAASQEDLTHRERNRARELIQEVERADNPEQVAASLSKEDRELIAEAIRVRDVRIEQSVEGAPAGGGASVTQNGGCLNVTTTLTGSSWVGDHWSYILETDYCYDGTVVTMADWQRYAEIHQAFWHFGGHIELDEDGQVGTNYYQVWTQGEFYSTFAGTRVDSAYPWLEQTFHGDGTWSDDGDFGDCSNC